MPQAKTRAVAPRTTANDASSSDGQFLVHMAMGKWVSQALHVAAELGLADVLKDGPKRVEQIAIQTGSNPDALYRVLRALASLGVFEETTEKRFENNALSSALRSDVPDSVRAMVRWIGCEAAWRAWSGLGHSVRTGGPAFDHVLGEPLFEYLARHPSAGKIFDGAMTSYTSITGDAIAGAYDFSQFRKLVDVGGGHGALLVAISKRYAGVQGILFDRAEVIAGARRALSSARCAERSELRAGDFLEDVPAGGDGYIMKHVIHDWDDERSVRILANCRRAMVHGGKIVIVEQVVGDGPEASVAKLLDLEMLVMTPGGRERTMREFAALLKRAGLRLNRVVPTESLVQVIEAVDAGD